MDRLKVSGSANAGTTITSLFNAECAANQSLRTSLYQKRLRFKSMKTSGDAMPAQ